MRAYVVGAPGRATLDDVAIPDPAPGEVRMRVAAVGLNHMDVFIREGLEGPGIRPVELPHVSGGDVAGRVDAVGAGVEGWQAGDRVTLYPDLSCGACRHWVYAERQRLAPTRLDDGLMALLDAAVRDAGEPPLRMVSGALHDTALVAAHVPGAMLFVPCEDGISHSPRESARASDAALAVDIALTAFAAAERSG